MAVIRTIGIVVAAIGALATTSCSGGTSSASCVSGRTVECACTSGSKGAQTCTAAGIYSPCSCGSSSSPTPAPTAGADAGPLSCDNVVAHIVDIMRKAAVANGDEISQDDTRGVHSAILDLCTSLDWPVAARQCALDAGTETAVDDCMRGVKGMEFIEESKTAEARQFVKKLYDGARVYYMDRTYDRHSIQPMPPQFPTPSVGPTPPLGECCAQGGKCEPMAGQWDNDTWRALYFSVDDPHYYSYEYIVPNEHAAYTVRAYGDLDCDGNYSTFEMMGVINSMYSDGPAGSASIATVNELE